MEGHGRAATATLTGKMSAPHASRTLCACVLLTLLIVSSAAKDTYREPDNTKLELFDGVSVKISKNNDTGRIISLEIDTEASEEHGRGRGTSKGSKNKKLMQRILPLFIMPFLIQSTIVPFFLSMVKFMLFKSLMVGKLALGLILMNAFKNHNTSKGRHDGEMANAHYGYQGYGMEEMGSYFN